MSDQRACITSLSGEICTYKVRGICRDVDGLPSTGFVPGGARRDGEEVAGCPQQGKCHERVDVRGMRQNCWAGGGP